MCHFSKSPAYSLTRHLLWWSDTTGRRIPALDDAPQNDSTIQISWLATYSVLFAAGWREHEGVAEDQDGGCEGRETGLIRMETGVDGAEQLGEGVGGLASPQSPVVKWSGTSSF